jgi:restriction endonuclease Mrr
LIDSDGAVRADLKKKGIAVCRPQITVVVGQNRGDIDPELLRKLYDRARNRGAIDPRSYSDIYSFAKEHYDRAKTIVIPSFHFADEEAQFPDLRIQELIDRLTQDATVAYTMSPRDFETVVARLLESFGYGVELTPQHRDGGHDIIAIRDGIATSKLLIECKRFSQDRKVGVEVVRSMYGVVAREGATKGMVVTTGTFTRDAQEFLNSNRWVLEGVDFQRLVEWLKQYKKEERGDLI